MFNKLRKNMRGIVIVVAIAFVASLFYGGISAYLANKSGQTAMAQNIAVVNGQGIPWAVFLENLQFNLQQQEMLGARVTPMLVQAARYNTMEGLINEVLLLQEAKRQKISVSRKEVNARLDEIKASFPSEEIFREQLQLSNLTENTFRSLLEDSLKVEKVLANLRQEVTITEEEIERAYEEVNAAHILIKPDGEGEEALEAARSQGEEILAQLAAGADFAELARNYSQDEGTREAGGELGFFSRGQMVAPFEEAAFALEVGEVSELVESQYGYHIIKVLDRKTADDEEYAEVRDSLGERLRNQKVDQATRDFLQGLREQADVVVHDPQIRAHGLLIQGDLDGAIDEYQLAVENQPEDAYLRVTLAQAYIEKEAYEEGVAQLEKAIEQVDSDAQLHLLLGLTYLEVEREDDAVQSFLRASERAPYDFLTQLQVSGLLRQMDRMEEVEIVDERIEELKVQLEEQMRSMEEEAMEQEEAETEEDALP
ncbi:MAG: peptidylprolyl isomerase [Limnochordia bacterium]|jgi:parvulin-like peptidyl-prolyl isomerase